MLPLRAIALSICLLLAGCSLFKGGGSETGVGGVSGVVVDHAHTPINAAVVTLSGGSPPAVLGTATTNRRGEFQINNVKAARNLTLNVTKAFRVQSMTAKKTGVRVGGGNINDLGEIELQAQ